MAAGKLKETWVATFYTIRQRYIYIKTKQKNYCVVCMDRVFPTRLWTFLPNVRIILTNVAMVMLYNEGFSRADIQKRLGDEDYKAQTCLAIYNEDQHTNVNCSDLKCSPFSRN